MSKTENNMIHLGDALEVLTDIPINKLFSIHQSAGNKIRINRR